MQGYIIIVDEEPVISRVKEIAPDFLWDIESHVLENEDGAMKTMLVCRKKFWAIHQMVFEIIHSNI